MSPPDLTIDYSTELKSSSKWLHQLITARVGYALVEKLYNSIFKTIIKLYLFNYNAMSAFTLKPKVRLSLQNIAGVNSVAVAITTITFFKQYKLCRMRPNPVILKRSTASSIEIEFLQV